jgi:hypothetical protein
MCRRGTEATRGLGPVHRPLPVNCHQPEPPSESEPTAQSDIDWEATRSEAALDSEPRSVIVTMTARRWRIAGLVNRHLLSLAADAKLQ